MQAPVKGSFDPYSDHSPQAEDHCYKGSHTTNNFCTMERKCDVANFVVLQMQELQSHPLEVT